MALCDANYCFTLIDIGDAGRHSDGGVLSNSAFGQAMESGELHVHVSIPKAEVISALHFHTCLLAMPPFR